MKELKNTDYKVYEPIAYAILELAAKESNKHTFPCVNTQKDLKQDV